jgi:hypothetical protein
VDITFATGITHIWSGVGNLLYTGNTYLGVGTMGKVGRISEGVSVTASGTTLSLSGIDPTFYEDTINDINLGAPAVVYMALLNTSTGGIIGAPLPLFSGLVDQPTITEDDDTITVMIALETRLTNLQRANVRRYTSADQRNFVSLSDSFFDYVEQLNDVAELWG